MRRAHTSTLARYTTVMNGGDGSYTTVMNGACP